MERDVKAELSRSVKASGVFAETIKDFLDGLGIYSLGIAFLVFIQARFGARKDIRTKPIIVE